MKLIYQTILCLALVALGSCSTDSKTEESTVETIPADTAATTPPPSPESQIISYQHELSSGSLRFHVSTTGEGTMRNLAIQVEREGEEPTRIDEAIEGTVDNSVLTDLNGNKKPELLVFVTGGGTGSYGKVYGYEFDPQYWGELKMPELTPEQQEGYMGHDAFKAGDGRLFRTFPVYLDADPNCCPSGGKRTIVYTLNNALNFVVERVE